MTTVSHDSDKKFRMTPDSTAVKRTRHSIRDGRPHGALIAELPNGLGWAERVQRAVREQTPDDWWASAIQHTREQHGPSFGVSPLADLIHLLLSDLDPDGLLVPHDVRQAMEGEAYEAAREAIIQIFNDHIVQMAKATGAIR